MPYHNLYLEGAHNFENNPNQEKWFIIVSSWPPWQGLGFRVEGLGLKV